MGVIIGHISTSTSSTAVVTTPPIDTTGANVIYIVGWSVFTVSGTPPGGFDNKGNTYVNVGDPNSTCNGGMVLRRCFNPVVGSGHTFSISGSPSFSTEIAVVAMKVANVGVVVNDRNGNQVNPVQCSASITPAGDDYVYVSAATAGCGWTSMSVDSGFTILETQLHLGLAYLTQSIAATINPIWSILAPGGIGGSTGATVMESMGTFAPTGGDWRVYEA